MSTEAATTALNELPYETVAPNAYKWTERAYELLGRKLHASVTVNHGIQKAVVEGKCPRCEHNVSFVEILDAVTGEDMKTLGVTKVLVDSAEFVELAVQCRCTEPHKGRTRGVTHGCGINFRIDVITGK